MYVPLSLVPHPSLSYASISAERSQASNNVRLQDTRTNNLDALRLSAKLPEMAYTVLSAIEANRDVMSAGIIGSANELLV